MVTNITATRASRRWRVVAPIALVVTLGMIPLSMAGCASSSVAPTVVDNGIPTPLPADVSASGVVLAAYLMTSGDIESAVAEGLVSPTEVDLAKKAIADGTLESWVELAQQP